LCQTPRRSRTTSDHSILPSCSQRLAHASEMYQHPHRLYCVGLVPRPLISRDFILTEMVSLIQIGIMKKVSHNFIPSPHYSLFVTSIFILVHTYTTESLIRGQYCVFPPPNAFPCVLSARVIELTPLNPFKIKERSTMPAAYLGCSIIPTWFRIPKRRKDTNKYYLWSQLASDSKIRKQSNNFCSSNLKIVYTRNLNLCS
jgi:hypothetical protein